MTGMAYTYRVVKYTHDPAAGEALNVGVLLFAPEQRFVGVLVDNRFERLSRTFAGFDGEHYRGVLRRFETAIDELREGWLNTLPLSPAPESVLEISTRVWPDEGLSFRLGPMLAGVTDDPERELRALYERMVTSQYVREERARRSDEEVWGVYKRPLLERAIASALRQKTLKTSDLEITFEHAFKNENWHILQPISMDYARAESIQAKAALWLGNGTALQGHKEISNLYLLLGRPQIQAHMRAYDRAKNLLKRMPIPHELIEEDEADDFAHEISRHVRRV